MIRGAEITGLFGFGVMMAVMVLLDVSLPFDVTMVLRLNETGLEVFVGFVVYGGT